MIPGACLPLFRGYIHVYDHYFLMSSSLKLHGQLKPNCMWSLLGKGGYKFMKMVLDTQPRWLGQNLKKSSSSEQEVPGMDLGGGGDSRSTFSLYK